MFVCPRQIIKIAFFLTWVINILMILSYFMRWYVEVDWMWRVKFDGVFFIIYNFTSKFFKCLSMIDLLSPLCWLQIIRLFFAGIRTIPYWNTNRIWFAFKTTVWHASAILIHFKMIFFTQTKRVQYQYNFVVKITMRTID